MAQQLYGFDRHGLHKLQFQVMTKTLIAGMVAGRILTCWCNKLIAGLLLTLTLTLTLIECGAYYNLDLPITLSVDSPEIPEAAAQAYFSYALAQLGGRSGPGSSQVIHIKIDADASCNGCDPLTVEHVGWHSDTIEILPRKMIEVMAEPNGLQDCITHGVMHVLGWEFEHLDPSTHAMMTPFYENRPDHIHYLLVDKLALCSKGRAYGGDCVQAMGPVPTGN